MAEKTTIRGILAKGLFILGIIIVVLILAFAVIKIVPRIFSSFASVGNAIKSPFADKSIDVRTSDDETYTNEPVIVYWDYEPTDFGVYEFRYSCVDNVEVSLNTNEGAKALLCNSSYKFNSEINSIEITPTLSKVNSLVTLPLFVKYTDETGNILADGKASLKLMNEAGNLASSGSIINTENVSNASGNAGSSSTNTNGGSTNSNVTNTGNTSVNVAPTTPVYYSPADLIATNGVEIDDGIIAFTISNIGGRASGNWYFSYRTPDGELNTSPLQASLRPGDALRFTMRFDDLEDGNIVITADAGGFVAESNEFNNILSIRVDEVGNGGSGVGYNRNDDANLEITSMEVGRMDGSRFREDDDIDEDDDAAVQFVVVNNGGESTGSWRFEITNAPYDDGDDDEFRSSRQSSMRPGESRTITVEFNNPDEGTYRIRLEVDSDDDVEEEDERDNDETETLRVRD